MDDIRMNDRPKTEELREETLPHQTKRPSPRRIRNKRWRDRNVHVRKAIKNRERNRCRDDSFGGKSNYVAGIE